MAHRIPLVYVLRFEGVLQNTVAVNNYGALLGDVWEEFNAWINPLYVSWLPALLQDHDDIIRFVTRVNENLLVVRDTIRQDIAATTFDLEDDLFNPVYGIVAHITTARAEAQSLQQELLDAVQAISGGADPGVVPALDRIVGVIEALRQNIVFQLGQDVLTIPEEINRAGFNLTQTLGAFAPLVGLPAQAAARNTLLAQIEAAIRAGTARPDPTVDVAAALQAELPDLEQALTALTRELTGARPDALEGIAQAELGLSPAVLLRLAPYWRYLAYIAGTAVTMYGPEIAQKATENVPALARTFDVMSRQLAESYIGGIGFLTGVVRPAFEGGVAPILAGVQAELDGLGELHPGNAPAALPRLLSHAASMGLAAHLTSIAAEHITPAKHLGLSQLAGFIADFAAFGEINRLVLGLQVNAGLGEAMRRRANLVHRARLPDPQSVDQMFLEGRITEARAREYYAEQGWADEWIQAHLEEVFREANPRDLAAAFEEGEIDLTWARQHLQESGFVEGDALRIAAGIRARALRPYRSELREAVVGSYVAGLLPEAALPAALAPLGLSPEALELLVPAATLQRQRAAAEAARRELEDSAALGQITPEDLEASLAALGYDELATGQAAFRARVRLGQKLYREEQAEIKRVVRAEQQAGVSAALEQFRRGILDGEQLARALEALEVSAAEIKFLVLLARARQVPVPEPPRIVTAARLAQLVQDAEADAALALLRRRVVTEDQAVALLERAGLGADLARAQARAESARFAEPPAGAVPPSPEEILRATQRAQTDAALERFRAGLVSEGGLRGELAAAGNAPGVAAALVARELAARAARQGRAAEAELRRQLGEIQRAEEAAAVAAFRAGRLDAGRLLQTLVALGVHPRIAEAIVDREESVRARQTAAPAA